MIRRLKAKDCKDVLGIYAYYIKNTTHTFETEVPEKVDFENRILGIAKRFPFFVLEENGKIVGYAYATEHNQRQAYRFCVNVSIYVDRECVGRGVGKKLYDSLFEELCNLGYYNAFSCITIPNERSVNMHEKYQFKKVGRFENAGYKFGQWHDVLWMQKQLKQADNPPKEPTKE